MADTFAGLTAAVHTPMREDGSLRLEMAGPVAEHLARDGVGAILVCGSTGEGMSLTVEERKAVAEAYVTAARGASERTDGRLLRVIIHVGHNSLKAARELASHAAEAGADAVAAAPPSYFKPATIETLAECCAETARGAPGLPFYYYHIPSFTGAAFPMVDFLREATRRVPDLAGLKFTFEDLADYGRCLEVDGGRYDVLFGRDEMLLSGLATGARGAVGSTYNYAAPLYRRLWDAFERGDMDEARRCQSLSVAMVAILRKYGGIPCGKAMMRLVGLDLGPCRLPLVTVEGERLGDLESDLREIGFFEWARDG